LVDERPVTPPIGQVLTTPRMWLEPCRSDHFDGLQALNADPVVM
jgi:hypothetical protein